MSLNCHCVGVVGAKLRVALTVKSRFIVTGVPKGIGGGKTDGGGDGDGRCWSADGEGGGD